MSLIPTVPYFDLPAGMMMPLIDMDDILVSSLLLVFKIRCLFFSLFRETADVDAFHSRRNGKIILIIVLSRADYLWYSAKFSFHLAFTIFQDVFSGMFTTFISFSAD